MGVGGGRCQGVPSPVVRTVEVLPRLPGLIGLLAAPARVDEVLVGALQGTQQLEPLETGGPLNGPGAPRMRAVRSCGTQMCTSVSRSMAPSLPPPRPVSATTVISRSWAASAAASTLAELPLVDSASSTSPAWPSARTCLANTRL